jgi:hypothetical protein
VGHVDTETRSAVFYHLSEVKPGALIRRAYGSHYPDRAELRLVTCGGTFDTRTPTCSANVIVSADSSGRG